MKEILRVRHRKLASPPFSFTEKHSRPEEPKVILELIGKYQSECTLPHQSETPFVGEQSFSNEQSVRAGGFFFPLPLSLPQFFFLSPTLGKLLTSPQLSTVFLFQDIALWCKKQIEHSIWGESLLLCNCACSLEYSSLSTLAGLSYHICGKLEVAFKGSPSSQHQHCTDEAENCLSGPHQ